MAGAAIGIRNGGARGTGLGVCHGGVRIVLMLMMSEMVFGGAAFVLAKAACRSPDALHRNQQ